MQATNEKDLAIEENRELTPKRDPYEGYFYAGEYAEEAYLDMRQRTRDAQ